MKMNKVERDCMERVVYEHKSDFLNKQREYMVTVVPSMAFNLSYLASNVRLRFENMSAEEFKRECSTMAIPLTSFAMDLILMAKKLIIINKICPKFFEGADLPFNELEYLTDSRGLGDEYIFESSKKIIETIDFDKLKLALCECNREALDSIKITFPDSSDDSRPVFELKRMQEELFVKFSEYNLDIGIHGTVALGLDFLGGNVDFVYFNDELDIFSDKRGEVYHWLEANFIPFFTMVSFKGDCSENGYIQKRVNATSIKFGPDYDLDDEILKNQVRFIEEFLTEEEKSELARYIDILNRGF